MFSSTRFSTLMNPRFLAVLSLGFASGFPLALSGSTLQAWYTVSGIDIETIGWLTLVGQPYIFKFLWSPFVDRWVPPWLDRRRGWITLSQVLLIALLMLMAFLPPDTFSVELGVAALLVAFVSATQDIAIDAYRTDALHPDERALGAAWSVSGYRIAMVISGGIALLMADTIGWHNTYIAMALIVSANLLFTILSPRPEFLAAAPADFRQAVTEPFKAFFSRHYAVMMIVLIVLYKLGDAFAGSLTTPFLLRAVEFSLTDVGLVTKSVGLAATLGGVFLGGVLYQRIGLFRSLLVFGLFQAVTNLGFLLLAMAGKNYFIMVLVIAMENLAGGMGTAAFVAFLMALCDHRFSATQFALFSALAAVGRVYVGPVAGIITEHSGWVNFFIFSTLMALPGLLMLLWMRKDIESIT